MQPDLQEKYSKTFLVMILTHHLIPTDVTAKRGEYIVVLQTIATGDSLFNTASVVLFGHEDHAILLHLLVAGKLAFNAKFYADHGTFSETSR